MKVNEDDVMDLKKYADIMKKYKDVYSFIGNRIESINKAVEKKFGKKGEEERKTLVGAISYSYLLNAVTTLVSARAVLDTDAINDLIDGFIKELEDIKKSPDKVQ